MPATRHQVLVVTPWYPTKSMPNSGSFVRELARAASSNHDVFVLHLSSESECSSRLGSTTINTSDTLPVLTVSYRRVRPSVLHGTQMTMLMLRATRTLRQMGFQPSIIHAHVGTTALSALLLGKIYRRPLIVHEHLSRWMSTDSPLTRSERVALRIALPRALEVLPVSHTLEQTMRRLAPTARYRVVPNVVGTRFFEVAGQRVNDHLEQARLLSVGNLIPRKRIHLCIEVLKILRDEGWDAILDVVGDGPQRPALEALVSEFAVRDFVRFRGELPSHAIADMLKFADVFLSMSTEETFGVAISEAVAAGVPVVTTMSGGPSDFVSDQVGRIVRSSSPEALAAAVEEVLRDPSLRDRSAISKHAARFSPKSVAASLDDVYSGAPNH